MTDGEDASTDANSPKNPFSVYMQIAFDGRYGLSEGGGPRHNLKSGAQMPVEVVAELDRKTDDGKPYKGGVQFSTYSADGGVSPEEGSDDACTPALDMETNWNLRGGNANCGVAVLM
jgi:hypothetical protein